jgi:hypothetical protein
MRARWALFAVAIVALGGCSSNSAKAPEIGSADAYVAIVNWEVGQLGPPATNAPLPVVYVASEEGNTIDAGAQVRVVQATVDTAKVRFTDVRDDALAKDVEGLPVKDSGVMLVVAKIDGKGKSRIDVPVTIYVNEQDQTLKVLTLVATTAGALVTSASSPPSG